MHRPEYLVQGEAARLFPVLATTSKEGRTTSIVLACIAVIEEFGQNAAFAIRIHAVGDPFLHNASGSFNQMPPAGLRRYPLAAVNVVQILLFASLRRRSVTHLIAEIYSTVFGSGPAVAVHDSPLYSCRLHVDGAGLPYPNRT